MKQLKIKLNPLPYPYEGEQKRYEDWGNIKLVYSGNTEIKEILNFEWNVLPFIEWYLQIINELEKSPPFEVKKNESLAEALIRQIEIIADCDLENDEDDNYDILYEFRKNHDLSFGFKGTSIGSLIIGINNGEGEISSTDYDIKIAYQFEIKEFLKYTLKECYSFASEWYKLYGSLYETQRERVRNLQNKINILSINMTNS